MKRVANLSLGSNQFFIILVFYFRLLRSVAYSVKASAGLFPFLFLILNREERTV